MCNILGFFLLSIDGFSKFPNLNEVSDDDDGGRPEDVVVVGDGDGTSILIDGGWRSGFCGGDDDDVGSVPVPSDEVDPETGVSTASSVFILFNFNCSLSSLNDNDGLLLLPLPLDVESLCWGYNIDLVL